MIPIFIARLLPKRSVRDARLTAQARRPSRQRRREIAGRADGEKFERARQHHEGGPGQPFREHPPHEMQAVAVIEIDRQRRARPPRRRRADGRAADMPDGGIFRQRQPARGFRAQAPFEVLIIKKVAFLHRSDLLQRHAGEIDRGAAGRLQQRRRQTRAGFFARGPRALQRQRTADEGTPTLPAHHHAGPAARPTPAGSRPCRSPRRRPARSGPKAHRAPEACRG